MKKTILALLLALCLVVCLTAVTVSATETTSTEDTTTTTEHVHCVCGGAPTNRVVLTNTTEGNPIALYELENTVDVTGTTWFQGCFSGMTMTVTGADFTVTYGEETLTPLVPTCTETTSNSIFP